MDVPQYTVPRAPYRSIPIYRYTPTTLVWIASVVCKLPCEMIQPFSHDYDLIMIKIALKFCDY